MAKGFWTPNHQPYVSLPETVATKFGSTIVAEWKVSSASASFQNLGVN